MKTELYKKVKATITEDAESEYEVIEKGQTVEGFLNSYHLLGCYSMQVEMSAESGGVSSGIVVVNVPIDFNTLQPIESELPDSNLPEGKPVSSIAEKIKPYISNEEAVVSRWIREDAEHQPKEGKPMSAEEFIKSKLNEKTGQGITLYEHYLAHDTTISIGTALTWMKEYSHQPKEVSDEMIEKWAEKECFKRWQIHSLSSVDAIKSAMIYTAKAMREGKIADPTRCTDVDLREIDNAKTK